MKKYIPHALYILILGSLCLVAKIISSDPLYDFDMVCYMGVMLELDGKNAEELHREVYSELKSELSPDTYETLLDGGRALRRKCYESSDFFFHHLSFYRVKPLYNYIGYWIHKKCNLSLISSLFCISVISYIGIGILFYHWIRASFSRISGIVVVMLVMGLAPIADLLRDFTPDALSNFLILLAVYFYFINRKLDMSIFLMLATLARIDNFVLMVLIGVVLLFFDKFHALFINYNRGETGKISNSRVDKLYGVILIVIGLSLFLAIPHWVGNDTNWVGKFSHTFSVSQYISEVVFSMNAFRYSHFQLILVFGIILSPLRKYLVEQEIKILLIILLAIGVRLILFPSFQDRFFISYELLLIIVLSTLMKRSFGVSIDEE
ncbi:MAG: hypothetical protein AAF573_06350 [Bacteroidota bacterium]